MAEQQNGGRDNRFLANRLQELVEVHQEYKNENDRAAVIIGTAKLDSLLYQILSGVLIPNSGSRDELLDGDSPLSTYSARINMCYRLGLISAKFARALHITRRIRNIFAHEFSTTTLDQGSHKDRVKELVLPFQNHDLFYRLLKTYYDNKPDPSTLFRCVLSILIVRLQYARDNASPLKDDNALELILPEWLE